MQSWQSNWICGSLRLFQELQVDGGFPPASGTEGKLCYGQVMVQTCEPRAQGTCRGQNFGAHQSQQQQGRATLAPALSHVVQHIQRSGIGPLDVINEEHDRASLAEGLQEAGYGFKQANACRRFIARHQWQRGIAIS